MKMQEKVYNKYAPWLFNLRQRVNQNTVFALKKIAYFQKMNNNLF